MIRKLMWNDIRQNKLLSAITVLITAVCATLFALTVFLFVNLLGSVDGLMKRAETPDFLQMHKGELEEKEIEEFAKNHTEIKKRQICKFLNLENVTITLGNNSLADSTQDNGLCVQGEQFDYLLDMENKIPEVRKGQVYVPVCYRIQNDLNVGDEMQIGSRNLLIAGFLRDSQMNSMMASSKRFLVNATDYESIKNQGEEEYLIEFLLQEKADVDSFATAYVTEKLPANGPTITKPLIRVMNALSDGMMIMVILLVGIAVLLVSLLCINFITAIQMEKDKKEIGMLKSLGISKGAIRCIYFSKYMLLSVCVGFTGFLVACLLQAPLARQMQELYGKTSDSWKTGILSFLTVLLIDGLILLFIWYRLKRAENVSVLEALFAVSKQEKRESQRQYILIGFVTAICVFLMLVPQNLYSTLESPKFVTYMGIGDGEIRMDVRQTEDIDKEAAKLSTKLKNDTRVEKYTVLETRSYAAFLPGRENCNLIVEEGDHSIFPVSYVSGRLPKKQSEIALSTLNADNLGLTIGDTLELQLDGGKISYTVCGIYSDITNGGKTAQVSNMDPRIKDDTPAMWSILYVSLNRSISREQWMKEYSQDGVDVVDIADYMQGTYGQTLKQIELARMVAVGIAVLIIFIVVMLFMRLILERERYLISLQKALGFSNKSIKKSYLVKGLLHVSVGITAGLLLGKICGEAICGMILKSFGADGFQFVIAWEKVLLFIPAISLVTAIAAVFLGITEVKKVTAFECCIGKE